MTKIEKLQRVRSKFDAKVDAKIAKLKAKEAKKAEKKAKKSKNTEVKKATPKSF